MHKIMLAIFITMLSPLAAADNAAVYDGVIPGRDQANRASYENCISKFKHALHPTGLGLNSTYYSGGSVKSDQRVMFINGSYFKDGQRVKVGIACRTNYRGAEVTSLKASIGGQYRLNEGRANPELFAAD